MASVTYNNAKKYRFLGQEEGLEIPQAHTLRDKILKDFVKRQISTTTSLEHQLQNQRNFVRATAEESITATTSGLTSYKAYKNLESSFNVKQILRSSGLSNDEIHLLLNEDTGSSSNEAPQAREERLKAIEVKLLKRQDQLNSFTSKVEHFNGAISLNRHDFEEECSVVPCRPEADKLTACLVRLQPHQDETIPENHPINHIQHLAEELFPNDATCQGDKPHKHKMKAYYPEGPASKKKKDHSDFIYLTQKPKSLWDMKKIPRIIGSSHSVGKKLHSSCILPRDISLDKKCKALIVPAKNMEPATADRTKPFVLVLDASNLISIETIKSNRKSIAELRNMEKFKNYNPGEPSSTLYIKNLSNKTSSQDLASLMGHFESNNGPKIVYRILGGRMKGQAFATFSNEEMATSAFNTCNGYVLHDKPIVIEYGKN